MSKIHKGNYKDQTGYYAGFGHYLKIPKPTCNSKFHGYGYTRRYKVTRLWKNVDCKTCLKLKDT